MALSTRTINIDLREQTQGARKVTFLPELTGADGEVLLAKEYSVTTDAAGLATVALPVKTSGSIGYRVLLPALDGTTRQRTFYLSAGSAIDLSDLIAGGTQASDTYIDLLDAQELGDHADVVLTSVQNNQALIYNSATSKWVNSAIDAEIADGAVTEAKLGAGAVTDAKVGTGISAAKLANGNVSNTEFQYLDGVTSAIQTQLDGKSATGHTHTASNVTDFDSAADARITAQKAQANGLATLDSGSKIPTNQLPGLALTTVNSVASEAAQLALTAQQGDVAIRTDLNKSFVHNGGTAGTMADWSELLTPTDTVTSVAGKTGVVTLAKADVGLSNVDNTSDANKPISTATQTALDGKVTKNADITGATKTKVTYDAKGLVTSGADATTADIADSTDKRYVTDAQSTVLGNTSGTNTGDQNIFQTIAVSGQSDVVADTTTDTVTFASSGNLAITTNASTDTVTFTGTEPTQSFVVACSDETTAITAGNGKVTFRMPYAFTVTAVRASLTTAQASGNIFTVDINESGTSILSTKLTIDNTETTSTTAATAPVISDTALADDAEISVDVDQIGNGSAKGLKVYIIGKKA